MIESEVERSRRTGESSLRQGTQAPAADRRRPGRAEVSPTLVPLLRTPAQAAYLSELEDDRFYPFEPDPQDALRPARGITVGLLVSIPLWAALFATVHTVLRLTFHS